jgi:peptidoglycan/xylan/chitin deacetylase (PgdA/CDA1 family)
MRAKLQKYKQIFFVSVSCSIMLFLTLGIFLTIERQKTAALQKKLNALDNIVAPYYEKSAFNIPKDISKNNNKKSAKIPIIMYHYVEYVKDAGDLIRKRLDVTPASFEEQLKSLRKAHYETYYVKEVPAILDGTIHYSTQSAILSFDDGYEDFYTDVFPLLKKYHMRATLYVIYDYIGRKGFLNEQQIRELIESDLVEIGSHTLDHIYLKIAPKEYADKQIIESKKKFEETFGIKIKTFAYPYGAFNNDNIETVKKAGYTAAVSVISGVMQSEENLFYMSRIRPGLFTPQSMIRSIEQMNK